MARDVPDAEAAVLAAGDGRVGLQGVPGAGHQPAAVAAKVGHRFPVHHVPDLRTADHRFSFSSSILKVDVQVDQT